MSIFTKDNPNIAAMPDTYIGDYTYGIPAIGRAYCGCRLDIGKFCSIGQGVQILFWGKHSMVDITTYPFNMLQGWPAVQCTEVLPEHIWIGNDVWIANNAIIMQGARIEDGAVIGAFSVVKGHVKPYSIVAGNPAREVKKRFESHNDIDRLLEMQWWHWPIEHIKNNIALINSPNVDGLYEVWKMEIK